MQKDKNFRAALNLGMFNETTKLARNTHSSVVVAAKRLLDKGLCPCDPADDKGMHERDLRDRIERWWYRFEQKLKKKEEAALKGGQTNADARASCDVEMQSAIVDHAIDAAAGELDVEAGPAADGAGESSDEEPAADGVDGAQRCHLLVCACDDVLM